MKASGSRDPLQPTSAHETSPEQAPQHEDLLSGDSYMDGPYVVFTAQYHLRRGYCCNSGCRHCPYRDDAGS